MKKILSFDSFNINEGNLYEYGCLMIYVDIPNFRSFASGIDKKDLYLSPDKEERYGIEDEPHITILYGFHDNEIDFNELSKEIRSIEKPEIITSSQISLFENEEYDVLKYDIKSKELKKLNSKFSENFKNTNEYPNYNPHATIAYLNNGKGKKYIKKFKEPVDIIPKYLIYSKSNGEKIKYEFKE